jgi:exosome complex component MTR3
VKLSCAVHGPKPLARSATFSSSLQISASVKFAPFASPHRRGYIRDSKERDLSVHLETALKGAIICERWPKSGLDVNITVLEGEDEGISGDELLGFGGGHGWGMMNVLAGCITVASAALADARIDCLDLISGGIAAIVEADRAQEGENLVTSIIGGGRQLVLDPCPSEHHRIIAACVVGYLSSSDEITELWLRGDIPYRSKLADGADIDLEQLIGGAVNCASMTRTVLMETAKESADLLVEHLNGSNKDNTKSERKGMIDDHDGMQE